MQSTSVQSSPCATPEVANDMLSGLITQSGKGQIVKVVNTEVHEVDGLWIATATIEIEDMTDEDVAEENTVETQDKDDDDEKIGVKMGDGVDVLFGHGINGQQGMNETPPGLDVPEAEDIKVDMQETIHITQEVAGNHVNDNAVFATGTGEGIDEVLANDITVADDLQKEFERAEEAEGIVYVPQQGPQPVDVIRADDTMTYEERREAEEEVREQRELDELERLRREATPLQVEAPAETPL